MNVVFISPNFPPRFFNFAVELQRAGARVMAIGDTGWENLRPVLRDALSEYYFLPDLNDYDRMLRAVGHFVHRHGRIDRIDSLNETWLGVEAQLRADFNIPGQRPADLEYNRAKYGMKLRFREAGIPCAKGGVVATAEEGQALAAEIGYPLILKPEIGVGASGTHRVDDDARLAELLAEHEGASFLAEEMMEGVLVSYDGLAGPDGEILHCNSTVVSSGVMEIVSEKREMHYYLEREVPEALEAIGEKTVAAFDIRERFFHIEYFRVTPGDYRVIEVNVRPPGGFGMDLMNYQCDIDLYRGWARMITGRKPGLICERKYFVGHIARRRDRGYRRSREEVQSELGSALVEVAEVPEVYSVAMGNEAYIVRYPELAPLQAAVELIQEK